MIEYENLQQYNISFKQLISGPAPVGRILNYLVLTGKGVLKHRNGNRDLNLNDNIASAWCSEFMVGLGLVFYVEDTSNVYPLRLTDQGKKLYDLIKEFGANFNEEKEPVRCKSQLMSTSTMAYDVFFNIFKCSPICKNLCKYIINSNTSSFDKRTFKDDYFECFKVLYEGGTYNRNARTSTAANRVPSLLQLCSFFDSLSESNDYFIFDFNKLNSISNEYTFIPISPTIIKSITNEANANEKIINDLIAKYGIDGTVAIEIVTRNSSVQDIFRNNLIAKYGCKCAICNKSIPTVMVASHIVPASESNVVEKADCENGLLLCSLHDKLFDRYLISFDFTTGKLLYSECLKDVLEDYQLHEELYLEKKYMTDERREYLMKHNMEFFERNK